MAAPVFSSVFPFSSSGAGNSVDPRTVSATASLTLTSTQTVALVVACELNRVDSISASDGVNTYTQVGGLLTLNLSLHRRYAILVAKNCSAVAGGTLTVSGTGYDNGNPWAVQGLCWIVDGCDATTPVDTSFSKSTSGSSGTSDPFTITATESIVLFTMFSNPSNTWAAGNIGGSAATFPSASRNVPAPNTSFAGEYKTFTSAQAGITGSMSGGSFDPISIVGLALKAPSGGGGGATINDANLRGAERGLGLGVHRGMSYHRHPEISLEAYRREQVRKHREFMAKVRRAA